MIEVPLYPCMAASKGLSRNPRASLHHTRMHPASNFRRSAGTAAGVFGRGTPTMALHVRVRGDDGELRQWHFQGASDRAALHPAQRAPFPPTSSGDHPPEGFRRRVVLLSAPLEAPCANSRFTEPVRNAFVPLPAPPPSHSLSRSLSLSLSRREHVEHVAGGASSNKKRRDGSKGC